MVSITIAGEIQETYPARIMNVIKVQLLGEIYIDISRKILIIDISHKNARQFVCTILSLNKTRAAKKTFYVI